MSMKQDLLSERTPEPAALQRASGEPVKAVPVQNRALRTRTALLDTVEVIVSDEGGTAVTTTRVAEMADVSVGTLYRYFSDRDALLLAAYDATVARIVATCAEALAGFSETIPIEDAARKLLDIYIDAAEEIPSHAGLLEAMREIRTIDADQSASNNITVIGDLLAPCMEKYAPGTPTGSSRFHFMYVLIGNLIDLYLLTPGTPETRAAMRREIKAHMLLALERTVSPNSSIRSRQ